MPSSKRAAKTSGQNINKIVPSISNSQPIHGPQRSSDSSFSILYSYFRLLVSLEKLFRNYHYNWVYLKWKEEGLCKECLDHHKRIKMSRNHTTIDAKQHEKLPSFILAVKPDCVEHKLQLELYCHSLFVFLKGQQVFTSVTYFW
jgi:hypothetical protein